MKNFTRSFSILLFITALSFGIISCSKDDDGGGGGSAAQGTITATVDGHRMTTMQITTLADISNQGNFKILSLQGNDSGNQPNRALSFNIIGYEGPGTYEIGQLGATTSLAQYIEVTVDPNNPTDIETNAWTTGLDANTVGEMKVSEETDTHIIGTFHFKGKSEDGTVKTISEGSFNVKLQ